ncbi:hypothetical protein MOO46_04245 [Apilactobacillus apisilvae]|uniref:Cell division protein n=1 Tax=Apilactobacillus apisilvae TaxID=2923364 RepID=A0ABY4PFB9_9LACO|nr:hypothetical protein [Apilactobacillus apisilvae]UQS84470.1 hypothetical protein MOO46_04245 [Apilactobacillus apisilvae]
MKRLIKIWPYLLIALVAILILLPQIVTGSYILGVDSIFHMNRFYEAAMQIKTGHFSYFLSIYGYQQSGRIINALYGPLAAYFNGLLLIIAGNWVRFQIISSLMVLITSGSLMYHLAIRTKIKPIFSLVVAISYMLSYLVMGWIVGSQFTGWAAALLPWLLNAGFDMVDYKKIKILRLALPMSVMLQVHIMTSLIGALALIPFFVVGYLETDNRRKMLLNAIYAVIITLCLTANVWYGMIQIDFTNHALPVAPQLDMHSDSIAFFGNHVFVLPYLYSVMLILAVIYFIYNWKKTSTYRKIIFCTGILFLWISSTFFPWQFLDNHFPSISYFIQMPRRFTVISFVLLIICFGIMINDHFKNKWLNYIKYLFLFGLLILISTNAATSVQKGIKAYFSPAVVQNNYNLHYQSYDTNAIRDSLSDKDLGETLKFLTKSTPDYLPVQYHVTPFNYFDFHPYGSYTEQIIDYSENVKKHINKSGHLVLNWHSNTKKTIQLPVVKYKDTNLILNGKHLNQVKLTNIGSPIVNAKQGNNRLELYYHGSKLLIAMLWLTIISWIILIGYTVFIYLYKLKKAL